MNSPDRPADTHLNHSDSLAKLREIAAAARSCMLTTRPGVFPPQTAPMSIQHVDDDGTIVFLSDRDSEKNQDLAEDSRATLTVQNDDKLQYLSLAGTARIHTDRATIERHWSPMARAWFEGKDDPRVTVISFHPNAGHYWNSDSGKIVAMLRMSFAALTGKRLGDEGSSGRLAL